MDARRALTVLRRWSWLLAACVLLAGGAAFLVSNSLPRMYEGKVTLIVGQSLESVNPDYNQLLASQRLSQTYADLVTTTPLLSRVIDREALTARPDELRKLVVADAPRDSTLITITVTDRAPERAASIANTMAEELIASSPAITGQDSEVQLFVDRDLEATQRQIESTQAEVDRLVGLQERSNEQEDRLQALQGRLASLRGTYATLVQFSSRSGSNLLTVVDPASPPEAPSSPRVLLNTLLAAMVGLLLAVGVAFLVEHLDDTLKNADDVEAVAGLPTLGAIMQMKGDDRRSPIYRLAAILYPRSPVAESYRTLRTNLEFAGLDSPVRTLLVTSSVPGEGKTTTAANLAAVFAQAGHRTLLVDGDLRKPGIHRIFDLPNAQGLTDLLRSEDLPVHHVAQAVEQPDLFVLTTGALPPNPAELLRSSRMRGVLERLRASAELVVIDSPPLQAVTDAAILASLVDGTIFVVDAGRTRRGAVRNGREALAKVGARVLGVVLNRLSESMSGDYYYYDYSGGYGAGGAAPKGDHPAAAAAVPGRVTD